MVIKTDMLRYFVEVAEAGNLTSAAKVLNRSPAAVSMMLKHFEEELGAPLFETDRKSRLTALGKFTLDKARREVSHFEGTVLAIQNFAKSGEGQVRIATMPAAAANLLPRVIEQLHAENPNIMVNVEDMTNDAILSAVRGENVDIGIVNSFTIVGHSSIKSSLLMTDRIGLLCARDSELGRKENLYWSDLATASIVGHILCDRIDEPAVRKAVANSRTRVASALSIQSFVRNGEYVSPMPELGGISLPSDLVFRVPRGTIYRREGFLIWNENQPPSPATIRLCKILRTEVAEMGMAPTLDDGAVIVSPETFT